MRIGGDKPALDPIAASRWRGFMVSQTKRRSREITKLRAENARLKAELAVTERWMKAGA